MLEALGAQALCSADAIDPKFEKFAKAKLARALELVRSAEEASKPKKRGRLLARAQKQLAKVARHGAGTTTAECRQTILAEVDAVADVIDGLETPS